MIKTFRRNFQHVKLGIRSGERRRGGGVEDVNVGVNTNRLVTEPAIIAAPLRDKSRILPFQLDE